MKSAKALLIISLLVPTTMFGMLARVNHLRRGLSSRIKTSTRMQNALRNKCRMLPVLLQKKWNSSVSNTEKIKELEEKKMIVQKRISSQLIVVLGGLAIISVPMILVDPEAGIFGLLVGSCCGALTTLPKADSLSKIQEKITFLKNKESQIKNDDKK